MMKIIATVLLLAALFLGIYYISNTIHGLHQAPLQTIATTQISGAASPDSNRSVVRNQNDRALHARLYNPTTEDFYKDTIDDKDSNIDNNLGDGIDDIWVRADSISDVLDELAVQNNWSSKENSGNALMWSRACAKADSIRNTTASLEELMAVNVMLGYQKMFADVCQDLHIQSEIDTLDFFLNSENLINESANQSRLKLERELEVFGKDEAFRLAVQLTKESVDRISESAITNMIGFIAFNELLQPITDDHSMNLNDLYLNVAPEVTTALLCSKFRGCSGPRNPVVLRQCIYRMEIGSGSCYMPENIYTAIYQTLTPLEFIAFESFYRQIVTHEAWHNS